MAMQRRDWEQGILAQALLEAGDRESVILLTKAAMVQRTPDGRLGVVVSGGPTDPAMGGAAYAKAAEWTGDKQMLEAVDGLLEWIRHKAPRNAEGILYHVFDAPEMWSDGFNGAPPFLAAMGYPVKLSSRSMGFASGYGIRRSNCWRTSGMTGSCNSRMQVSGAEAMAGLPPGSRARYPQPAQHRRQDRDRLAAFARQIIDGCLAHQRSDGLFHNIVDQPRSFVDPGQ